MRWYPGAHQKRTTPPSGADTGDTNPLAGAVIFQQFTVSFADVIAAGASHPIISGV
jgi:hypothetical protein